MWYNRPYHKEVPSYDHDFHTVTKSVVMKSYTFNFSGDNANIKAHITTDSPYNIFMPRMKIIL